MWQNRLWFKGQALWLQAQNSIALEKALFMLEGLLIMGSVLGGLQCYQLLVYAASLPACANSDSSIISLFLQRGLEWV